MDRPTKISMACSALLAVLAIGCDDDNSPTAPRIGTITVHAEPDSLDAPWILTTPAGQQIPGVGDRDFDDMSVGQYVLEWGAVPGRKPPSPSLETALLRAGDRVVFTGRYRLDPDETEPGFVFIGPGTFSMGSPSGEHGHYRNEQQHTVTLTRGFYMSAHEVTEQQWNDVMGGPPTLSKLPKGRLRWDDAVRYCNALSEREGLVPVYAIDDATGEVRWNREADGYRLPTEAEWEYACRATTTTAQNNGTQCLAVDTEANFDGGYPYEGCAAGPFRSRSMDVGSFGSNAWGLYDMHGNLWEWVWDGYRADYEDLPSNDPVHDVERESSRVLRGGGWSSLCCRSALRYRDRPVDSHATYGFRPVRTAF